MSPALAALLAAALLALVALILAAREVAEHRLAERVRRASMGNASRAPRRGLADIGAAVLRSLDLGGLARFLAPPHDRLQVERLVVPLGIPAPLAGPLLVVVKLAFLAGALGVAALWHLAGDGKGNLGTTLLIGLGAGVILPNMLLSQLRKRRIAMLNDALADTLDLMVVCAEAGLGLESAVERVAVELRRASPAMALEFAQLGQEMRLMPDRNAAMERFAERAEVDGLRRLSATLAQAMRYGTPLGQALRALSADERQQRLVRMEEKAARLPALLVLPLIMFILPPLFLVLVGPSMLKLFDALGAL